MTTWRTMSSSTQGSSGHHDFFITTLRYVFGHPRTFPIFDNLRTLLFRRNINLQNLKRASAFIDIMDRHLDTVRLSFLHSLIWLKSILFILFRISSILIWQLRRPKISWATTGMSSPKTRWSRTKESTRGIHGFSNVGYFKYKIFTIYSRYEIEWIGREGLAPETHDAYLKVKVIFGSYFL